ncbi:MAG TPA: TonB-dependent receptor [Longimicrobiaceae bacterium]
MKRFFVRKGRGEHASVRSATRPLKRVVPLLVLGLALPGVLAAQTVTGTVVASESGSPLPGVTVNVQGTDVTTVTDASGRYTVEVNNPQTDTLTFSSIGYATQNVPVNGRTTIDVTLVQQAVALEELVVVGYGTQQRRDVTGAVASVETEDVAQVATPNVEQALQGRIAGVQVSPNSGEPGQSAVVRIRGVGTLNNASPLYVVDGMLLDDISFLNPNDIASMEVLKDASATAIYGSRGANGVIIVTTKQGAIDTPTRFTVSAYAGFQEVQNPIDMVNARQYAELANELAANQGLPEPYFPDPAAVGPGTDWQDEIFRTAPIQNYQASVSGGSDRVSYYFSGNFIRQDGIIPKSDYERITLRLNNDYDLTETLRLGNNFNFSYIDDKRAPNVLRTLYYADPTIQPRDENGNFTDGNVRSSAGNPAATVFYTNNGGERTRLVGNLFAELDFLNDFTFRTSFGVDHDRDQFRNFVPEFIVSPIQQNVDSDLTVETTTNSSWLWENTVNYDWVGERHRVSAVAGITAQSFYTERLGGSRTNLVGDDPSLWYLNAGDEEGQTNFNTAEDWRMLSYLFRTNYALLDRYLLTASLRIDGSSRFGSENRYGWFPSVAVGWDLAQEAFMQDYENVSALKLRASWGQIGNDKIGAYPGIPVVTGNLNAIFGEDETMFFGASPIELANPDVKWERTSQTNIGLDASFFDGRVGATLDWYNRLTDGILVRVPIPDFVGVSTQPFVNAAEVLNRGFEATLELNQQFGELGVSLGLNASTIDNEVKELGQGNEAIFGGGLGNEVGITTRTEIGHPIGAFWGFKVDGVFQTPEEVAAGPLRGGEQPGDLRYVDTNGDGVITDADKTFLGSPIPDVIYGMNIDLNWRWFDFSANFSGQSGNEVYNGKKAVRFGVDNFEKSFLNRWTGPGTSTTEPRVTNAGHNYLASERFIEDGSFFKLNSAQLGYRLPESVTSQLNLASARIYVNGTNLFTLTDYSGYTPELISGEVINSGIDLGVYPTMRVISFGMDVSF